MGNERKNFVRYSKIKSGLYIFFNIPRGTHLLLSPIARGRFLRFTRG
jgi:hypothetical protein